MAVILKSFFSACCRFSHRFTNGSFLMIREEFSMKQCDSGIFDRVRFMVYPIKNETIEPDYDTTNFKYLTIKCLRNGARIKVQI